MTKPLGIVWLIINQICQYVKPPALPCPHGGAGGAGQLSRGLRTKKAGRGPGATLASQCGARPGSVNTTCIFFLLTPICITHGPASPCSGAHLLHGRFFSSAAASAGAAPGRGEQPPQNRLSAYPQPVTDGAVAPIYKYIFNIQKRKEPLRRCRAPSKGGVAPPTKLCPEHPSQGVPSITYVVRESRIYSPGLKKFFSGAVPSVRRRGRYPSINSTISSKLSPQQSTRQGWNSSRGPKPP